MFTVTFDGVEYTKASEVAKEFGYTADYIGQLCRAKKIDARLVGRTWFVNTDTLHEHKQGRYKKLKTNNSETEISVETKETAGSKAEEVEIKKTGTASKKYLRRVSAPNARMHKIIEKPDRERGGVKHVSLHYESDDHSLIPKVEHSPKVTLLKVDVAGSEPLTVKSSNKASVLTPSELPDVALSGSLSISEVSDADYSNNESSTERAQESAEAVEEETAEKLKEEKSSERDNKENKVRIRKIEEVQTTTRLENVTQSQQTKVPKRPLVKSNRMGKIKVQRAGVVAMTRENSLKSTQDANLDEIPLTNLDTETQVVQITFRVPAVGLALGIIVGTLLLSAEQVALVTGETADFAIKFDWSNISNMALVLFTG